MYTKSQVEKRREDNLPSQVPLFESQAHPVLSEKIEPVCPASAVMKLGGKMIENVVDKDEDKQKETSKNRVISDQSRSFVTKA